MGDSRFRLVVPTNSVTFYEAGEHCTDARGGDFFLVNHGTLMSDVIEMGQEIERLNDPGIADSLWCTHICFARDADTVSEMGFKGYERRGLLDYKKRVYARVRFASTQSQIDASLAADDACSGLEYGWHEYIPLIAQAIDREEFAGSWGDSIVCSVHASLLARAQGMFPDRWDSLVYPALWAYWLGASHK